MGYEKPELFVLTVAISAVRSQGLQGENSIDHLCKEQTVKEYVTVDQGLNTTTSSTNAAYEADE